MKTAVFIKGLTILTVLSISTGAEELAIDGFSSNGELSWQDVYGSGNYTIEWSPSLHQTNWSSDWRQFSEIPATGGTIRIHVPRFFRVRHSTEASSEPNVIDPPSHGHQQAETSEPVAVVEYVNPQKRGFSGRGTGRPEDPYQITSTASLQEMEHSMSGHYVLLNDLDLSDTSDWDGGKGFRPIGTLSKPFTGQFDGCGHTIRGLRIARFGYVTKFIGMFGVTSPESAIRNLSVLDAVVAGCDAVGILVGRNQGIIANCHVSGIVSGSGGFGGLAGNNYGGEVARCSAKVGVRPLWVGNHLGGLIGYNRKGTIRDCFAEAVVTGHENPGGLVGVNNGGTIERCYAIAEVTSSYQGSPDTKKVGVGGFVAYNEQSGVLRDCFADGTVSGPAGLPAGALAGVVASQAALYNSYSVKADLNLCEALGRVTPDAGTVECETVEVIDVTFFGTANAPLGSWQFPRTWVLSTENDTPAYPRLSERVGKD